MSSSIFQKFVQNCSYFTQNVWQNPPVKSSDNSFLCKKYFFLNYKFHFLTRYWGICLMHFFFSLQALIASFQEVDYFIKIVKFIVIMLLIILLYNPLNICGVHNEVTLLILNIGKLCLLFFLLCLARNSTVLLISRKQLLISLLSSKLFLLYIS